MTVLGALSWPVIALGAAIAAGALLILKYWEPISAFFGGVIEGFLRPSRRWASCSLRCYRPLVSFQKNWAGSGSGSSI